MDFNELIRNFELEMSPATALQRPPLSNSPIEWREQARHVIHALWKARYPVDMWLVGAATALKEADFAYQRLFPQGMPPKITESSLKAFQDRCLELSEAVSRFPSRIPIV